MEKRKCPQPIGDDSKEKMAKNPIGEDSNDVIKSLRKEATYVTGGRRKKGVSADNLSNLQKR